MARFKIQTLNNIAVSGLRRLPRERYEVASDISRPDGILVRSHNMHDMDLPSRLLAVPRAGAGTNNIPVAELSRRGVPVFNAPGANANAVKELVIASMFIAARNLMQGWDFVRTLETEDDAPIIRLINGLIAEAVRLGASDIHVEPYDTALTVRLRVDGVLREVLSLPVRLASVIVSRIKVMARLDIAEKRIPQDGRISLTLGGKTFDVRVSTLPSRAGERVVMRIRDDGRGIDLNAVAARAACSVEVVRG